MKKLSFLGIGPKIGRIAIPYLLVEILLSIFNKELFATVSNSPDPCLLPGKF